MKKKQNRWEKTIARWRGQSFVAAKRFYFSEKMLRMRRIHPKEKIYRDIYGRKVLVIDERFPIFDSYDALYENRYYHYHYIQTKNEFVCVRTKDGNSDIVVGKECSVERFVQQHRMRHSDLLRAAGLIKEE